MIETEPELAPPLGDMPGEDFRRIGHELIDWVADYFEHIEDLPVLAQIEPGDLKSQLPAAPPEQSAPSDEASGMQLQPLKSMGALRPMYPPPRARIMLLSAKASSEDLTHQVKIWD